MGIPHEYVLVIVIIFPLLDWIKDKAVWFFTSMKKISLDVVDVSHCDNHVGVYRDVVLPKQKKLFKYPELCLRTKKFNAYRIMRHDKIELEFEGSYYLFILTLEKIGTIFSLLLLPETKWTPSVAFYKCVPKSIKNT